jgi:hypothetical protein
MQRQVRSVFTIQITLVRTEQNGSERPSTNFECGAFNYVGLFIDDWIKLRCGDVAEFGPHALVNRCCGALPNFGKTQEGAATEGAFRLFGAADLSRACEFAVYLFRFLLVFDSRG